MEMNISKIALEKIKEAIKDYDENTMIRIYVNSVGCSGAMFGIAIDEKREGDEITDVDGLKVLTDTKYIPVYSDGISIDYVSGETEGFIIKSIRPVAASTSCSGGCAGCHHE